MLLSGRSSYLGKRPSSRTSQGHNRGGQAAALNPEDGSALSNLEQLALQLGLDLEPPSDGVAHIDDMIVDEGYRSSGGNSLLGEDHQERAELHTNEKSLAVCAQGLNNIISPSAGMTQQSTMQLGSTDNVVQRALDLLRSVDELLLGKAAVT